VVLRVVASVTANVPLTVVADPDVDKVGVPVAQSTMSVKLAFICEATMFVAATNAFVTAKAAIYRNLRVLYMVIIDVTPHLPRVDTVGETLNLKLIACAVPIVGHLPNAYLSDVPSGCQSVSSQTLAPASHTAGVAMPLMVLE
jgi:hypothetical protein